MAAYIHHQRTLRTCCGNGGGATFGYSPDVSNAAYLSQTHSLKPVKRPAVDSIRLTEGLKRKLGNAAGYKADRSLGSVFTEGTNSQIYV